jgi:predicted dehydrogenase
MKRANDIVGGTKKGKNFRTMINAAIVGLGRWGRNLVNAVQGKSGKLRFTHAVVRRTEPASEFAAEQNIELATDFNRILSDPAVDAVVLATPHSQHVEQIVAAAAAGKPVFCEKPLALTRSEASLAVEACRRANVPLGLGHDKRFWGSMQALFKTVRSGELGEILHVEGHFSNETTGRYFEGWRGAEKDSPGGPLTATGVHILDTFVGIAGSVKAIQAHVISRPSTQAPVDTSTFFLEFTNRVSGVLCGVRTTPQFYRVHVFGTDGWAQAVEATELTVRKTDAQPERFTFEPVASLRLELEAFADAVSGVAPYPITPQQMIDGVSALEMAIASFQHASGAQTA